MDNKATPDQNGQQNNLNQDAQSAPTVQAPAAASSPVGTNVAQPAPQGQTVVGMPQAPGQNPSPVSFGPQPNGNKKRLVVLSAVGLAVLLFGSSAAAYFGYLVPNKPENIWSTALERTSAGYDKLVEYEQSTKDLTAVKFDGTYKISGDVASDGTMEGQFDDKNYLLKANVGAVTTRIDLEVRGVDSPASTNPDVYAKVSGLKGIGAMLGDTSGTIDAFDNQWYVADHTLLDSLVSTAGVDTDMQLTADDLVQIEKAVGEVNKEYLLSSDPDMRVLTVVQNVGKEKQDDRDVYKFKVGLDKQHTKDYLTAMVTKLESTPVKKFLDGKSLKEAVNLDELLKDVDKYNSSDTAEVFVDTETKTIRTVRFSDKDNAKNYLDVGVHYTGGDVVPFVLSLHSDEDGDKSTINVKLAVDMKKNTLEMTADMDLPGSDSSSPRTKGDIKLNATMSKDKVTVTKPTGAKSINELLAPFFGSGFTAQDGIEDIEGLDPSELLGGRLSI